MKSLILFIIGLILYCIGAELLLKYYISGLIIWGAIKFNTSSDDTIRSNGYKWKPIKTPRWKFNPMNPKGVKYKRTKIGNMTMTQTWKNGKIKTSTSYRGMGYTKSNSSGKWKFRKR